MCKDDHDRRCVMLASQLGDLASEDNGKKYSPAEIKSPGTPVGPQDKPDVFADSESSAVSGDDTASSRIFFARVPPLVPYQDLYALFSKFGTVSDLNLFRRWATARTSKGCGTVKFCKAEAASAALLALNGVHSFDAYPGCEGPMVVEWVDESRLSSADAAAAAKAAKAQAASSSKSQKRSQSKTCSGSKNSASKNSLPSWSYMQSMSALPRHHSDPNSAMAALAAVGMGQYDFAHGLHSAVEGLDLAGLYAGGPLSPDAAGGSSRVGFGLGDPSTWSTVIPVHLLPLVGQSNNQATKQAPGNVASFGPVLPSTASVFSQMNINSALMPSAAAAAPSPGSNASCNIDTFMMTGPQRSAGSFGCPTPSTEPWLSGGLSDRTSSANLSFSSQVPPAFGACMNSTCFLAAAAAAAAEQQQLQQQQMQSLMIHDDAWVSQSCGGCAPTNTANTGHLASGSYGLFDNSSLLMQLNDTATAAGACAATNASYSNQILSAPCAGAGAKGPGAADVTGFLSGHLSSVLTQSEGCMALEAGAGASAFGPLWKQGTCGGGNIGGAQAGAASVTVPLTDAMHSAVARHVVFISSISGAQVGTVFDSVTGVWGLTLQGTPAAVEAGRNLVQRLLSQVN